MDLKAKAQEALDYCLKAGADSAKISVSRSKNFSLRWRQGKVDTLQDSAPNGISLTLYVDGRYANHYTSDLRSDSLQAFIERTVKLTRYLEVDSFRKLPPKDALKKAEARDLQTYDSQFEQFKPEQALEVVKQLEARIKNTKLPLIDVTAGYGMGVGESSVLHSNGFQDDYKQSNVSLYGIVSLQDANGKKPRSSYMDSKRFMEDLDSTDRIAEEVERYAHYVLNQEKLKSGKMDLVFDNHIAAVMLSRYLSPIAGSSIQQKRSYFEGKLEQQIASPLLNVTNAPHVIRGLSSRLYDGDGFATSDLPLFENGVLKNYLIDYYHGLKLGMQHTTGRMHNLRVTTGDLTPAEIIRDVKKGIWVTSLLGGNADPSTGDFSYGLSGVVIENGELKQNVSEMNMTGNYLTLFSNLSALANDPLKTSPLMVPTMRFNDVDISGL